MHHTQQDDLFARRGGARSRDEVPRRIRGAYAAAVGRAAPTQRYDSLHRRDTHHRRGGSHTGQPRHGQHTQTGIARGELQTIGATTLDDFRENIESDSALERRFQKVIIEPTSAVQTLEILHNIAPYYERYHNVHYTEDALRACVALTERYITDRYFPDKAIDVLDEAAPAHMCSRRTSRKRYARPNVR